MRYLRKNNTLLKRLLLLLILCLCLVFCWVIGVKYDMENAHISNLPGNSISATEDFPYLAVTQTDARTDSIDETTIFLDDYVGEVLITEAGDYRLTGELEGCVRIQAEEQIVHLFLDNATITAKEGPALRVDSAGKVLITLTPDSSNHISDSGHYRSEQVYEACIASESDLTINGFGALDVYGLYKDAIHSKDIVKILGGNITVRCKRTGIRGNDGIYVMDGNISVSSEKDGFKTTKSGADGRGNLVIGGGNISLIVGQYAFVCARADLHVYNCSIYHKSVVDICDVGGNAIIQEGCVK